jgi:hypothetical protein
MAPFILLVPDGAHPLDALIDDDRVIIDRAGVRAALGWSRKPEGLCRGDVCIPVPPDAGLDDGDGIDLAVLARLLRRPLALDVREAVAFMGESARTRADALLSLEAPDLALADLEGRVHTLSGQRGKKVFLVAWASW